MPSALSLAEDAAFHFGHPQASRALWLGQARVDYAFTRGRRRSIGLKVGPEGLAVHAPTWTPLHEVDAVLQSKGDWILRQLQQMRERQAQQAAAQIEWREGALVPFLGQPLRLGLDAQLPRGMASLVATEAGTASGQALWLGLPATASADQIQAAARLWLMQQAASVFRQRLDHYAPRLGVQWRRLGLSNARTRWGSARADGSIRLNWRLIHLRLALIDYVVAHELSHLRVMDHSPRFWQTLQGVLPDYAQLRQQLKTEAVPR